ncbi:MAG: hypothetical protein J4N81_01045, partial [Chloroflexi bacterium]|nr:hypothetical protein [Chloroflexota bacterium]
RIHSGTAEVREQRQPGLAKLRQVDGWLSTTTLRWPRGGDLSLPNLNSPMESGLLTRDQHRRAGRCPMNKP